MPSPMFPPICPKCSSSSQVWGNQITGLLTCHRYGCEPQPSLQEARKPRIRRMGGKWHVVGESKLGSPMKHNRLATEFCAMLNNTAVEYPRKEHYAL
jgi:hypothetical protein